MKSRSYKTALKRFALGGREGRSKGEESNNVVFACSYSYSCQYIVEDWQISF